MGTIRMISESVETVAQTKKPAPFGAGFHQAIMP